MCDSRYISGYPKKGLIRSLWDDHGIDKEKIVFNADYGVKRAGFLWRSNLLDEKMKEWIENMESQGIAIQSSKFYGRIHSVWFQKKL